MLPHQAADQYVPPVLVVGIETIETHAVAGTGYHLLDALFLLVETMGDDPSLHLEGGLLVRLDAADGIPHVAGSFSYRLKALSQGLKDSLSQVICPRPAEIDLKGEACLHDFLSCRHHGRENVATRGRCLA